MNNIRAKRKAIGMGLRKLAELAGIDKSELSRIERGLSPLYPSYKARVEVILGPITETK